MNNNQIEQYLKILSLHRVNEIYQTEAENAAKTKLSYQDYLLRLLEAQVLTKMERLFKVNYYFSSTTIRIPEV